MEQGVSYESTVGQHQVWNQKFFNYLTWAAGEFNFSPIVSVITPDFNPAHYLNDSLVGVNRQTYQYFTHIVIDGGLTDFFCVLKFANQVSG